MESCPSTTKNISPLTTMPMAATLGRVVTYHEVLLAIKSQS